MINLEDIKFRLGRISPLPWAVDIGDEAYGVMTSTGSLTWDDHGGEVFTPEDAHFIAQAPEAIDKLIEVVEVIRNYPALTKEEAEQMGVADLGYAEGYNCAIEAVKFRLEKMLEEK